MEVSSHSEFTAEVPGEQQARLKMYEVSQWGVEGRGSEAGLKSQQGRPAAGKGKWVSLIRYPATATPPDMLISEPEAVKLAGKKLF